MSTLLSFVPGHVEGSKLTVEGIPDAGLGEGYKTNQDDVKEWTPVPPRKAGDGLGQGPIRGHLLGHLLGHLPRQLVLGCD